jgi:hypothetical protein
VLVTTEIEVRIIERFLSVAELDSRHIVKVYYNFAIFNLNKRYIIINASTEISSHPRAMQHEPPNAKSGQNFQDFRKAENYFLRAKKIQIALHPSSPHLSASAH